MVRFPKMVTHFLIFKRYLNESAVQWISRLLIVNSIYCHLWFGQIKADLRRCFVKHRLKTGLQSVFSHCYANWFVCSGVINDLLLSSLQRGFLCLHYWSGKQILILTDKGLCLYNSSSLFLYGFLWVVLGDRSFITSQEGVGFQFFKRPVFGGSILKMHRMWAG